jgi:ribosomal peptide maturation radical SAM protein 1
MPSSFETRSETRATMKDVSLVSMPFTRVDQPTMGPSLLKAGLARAGFSCDVMHLNLDYAAILGLEDYLVYTSQCSNEWQVGEWLFSHLVFDERASGADEFVASFADTVADSVKLKELLVRWRGRTDVFFDRILKDYDWGSYRIVGFSLMHQQSLPSLALARAVKRRWPGVSIVVGGPACEGRMGEAIHRAFPFVDYVCSGEGDLNVPLLVRHLISGEAVPDIPGIIRRDADGGTVVPSRMVCLVESSRMDELPVPDFADYFEQMRHHGFDRTIHPVSIVAEGSRGCWWGEKSHCTFCGLNGLRMPSRSKSEQRLYDEVLQLADAYPSHKIIFTDNIISMHHLTKVIPKLRGKLKDKEVFFEVKSNLNRGHMEVLKASGISEIQPGIESFHDGILKLMGKGASAFQNLQILKRAAELRMTANYNILYGFPGETAQQYAEMEDLLRLIGHLPAPGAMMPIRFERFTPYFDQPDRFGIRNLRPSKVLRAICPLPEKLMEDYAFFFEADFDGPPADAYLGCLSTTADWVVHSGERYLVAARNKDAVVCLDGRDLEHETEFVFQGEKAFAFDACDDASTVAQVAERASIPVEKAEECLNGFVREGLALMNGAQYVNLAVRADRIVAEGPGKAKSFVGKLRAAAGILLETARERRAAKDEYDGRFNLKATLAR